MYVLNEQGEPVPASVEDEETLTWWRRAGNDPETRRVALDRVGDYRVSTVFLGVDHQFEDGPPVLWETMVFGKGEWDQWQDRYTSRADAEAGHQRIVRAIQAGESPTD